MYRKHELPPDRLLSLTHFPYCIKRVGHDDYVLLNRFHLPLGFRAPDVTGAPTLSIAFTPRKLTPSVARTISFDHSEGLDEIYLYDDTCSPTLGGVHLADYLTRLWSLLHLRVERTG